VLGASGRVRTRRYGGNGGGGGVPRRHRRGRRRRGVKKEEMVVVARDASASRATRSTSFVVVPRSCRVRATFVLRRRRDAVRCSSWCHVVRRGAMLVARSCYVRAALCHVGDVC